MKMNKRILFLLLLFTLIVGLSDLLAKRILKINTSGIEDVPYISLDGDKLYFHYTPFKFSDFLKGKKTLIGPIRQGYEKKDFEREFFLGFVSESKGGVWGEPVPIKFKDKTHAWGSVDISSDGRFMYTIGNGASGRPKDLDIFVHTLVDGVWKNTTRVAGINTQYIEDDPDIARDNTFLVWDSDRPDGLGMRDIWYSKRLINGKWTTPQNFGAPINTIYNEQYPFLNEEGTRIYFNRAIPSELIKGKIHVFVSEKDARGQWKAPVDLDLGVDIALSPSLTGDEKIMYFEVGKITDNNPSTLFDNDIDIYYSVKEADGSWSKAVPVD